MKFSPEDIERRIAAKKNNVRVKLCADVFKTLSVRSLFELVFLPIIKQEPLSPSSVLLALLFYLLFQFAAQAIISYMRSED